MTTQSAVLLSTALHKSFGSKGASTLESSQQLTQWLPDISKGLQHAITAAADTCCSMFRLWLPLVSHTLSDKVCRTVLQAANWYIAQATVWANAYSFSYGCLQECILTGQSTVLQHLSRCSFVIPQPRLPAPQQQP